MSRWMKSTQSLSKTSLWQRVCLWGVCSVVSGSFSSWTRAHFTCPISLLVLALPSSRRSKSTACAPWQPRRKRWTHLPQSLFSSVTQYRTPFSFHVSISPTIWSLFPGHRLVFLLHLSSEYNLKYYLISAEWWGIHYFLSSGYYTSIATSS